MVASGIFHTEDAACFSSSRRGRSLFKIFKKRWSFYFNCSSSSASVTVRTLPGASPLQDAAPAA